MGTFRLLLFEVLQAFVDSECQLFITDHPVLEGIYNTTMQVILLWACELTHNNIFLAKLVNFMRIYVNRCSDVGLCNAFIRTRALEEFCETYVKQVVYYRGHNDFFNTQNKPFLEELLEVFEKTEGVEKKLFSSELNHLTKWRFAIFIRK